VGKPPCTKLKANEGNTLQPLRAAIENVPIRYFITGGFLLARILRDTELLMRPLAQEKENKLIVKSDGDT